MLDVRLMLQFAAVADELSFTKAARKLKIAQPWLSSRIRSLEEKLGVELFERTSRGVVLTPMGEQVYTSVLPLVAAEESLSADLKTLMRSSASANRVGVPATPGRDHTLERLFDRFEEQQPRVQLQVERGYAKILIERLRQGKLDFVFANAAIQSTDLERKPFCYHHLGLTMHDDDPLSACDIVDPEALRGRRIGIFARALSSSIDGYLETLRDLGARLQPCREVHDAMLFDPESGKDMLILSFIPDPSSPSDHRGLTRRQIAGAPSLALDIVRRKGQLPTPAREHFWGLADTIRAENISPHFA